MLAAKFVKEIDKIAAEATAVAVASAEAKAGDDPADRAKAAAKAKAEVKAIVEARMNGINVALPEGFTEPEGFKSPAERVGFLISTNLKFLCPIRPGDTMRIKVKRKGSMGLLTQIEAEVRVGNNLVAKGVIGLSERQ
jgi:3-hydroxymyristoyl/3-hydroxydecanoyl-(acyl carrier protein) dehydratase